jgi:hypothetical protein
MKNKLRKSVIVTFFLLMLLSVSVSLFNFWQIKNLKRTSNARIEELEYFYNDFREISRKEPKKNIPEEISPENTEKAWAIHEQDNENLKERSLKLSPDGTKKAYFQEKFISDIKDIGNTDYISLIVEKKNGDNEIYFKFHRPNPIKTPYNLVQLPHQARVKLQNT